MAPEVFAGSFARSPGDRKFHATQSAQAPAQLVLPVCRAQQSFTGPVAAASQFHGRGPVEESLASVAPLVREASADPRPRG